MIAPHLIKSVPYDALKDFDYITVAVQAPNVLAVPASSPHKTLADVIAFHKANPGKMSFASSGNGSSDHLTAELFWQQTGTSGLHIPYKGGAPAMTDLLGGQVDATFMNINTGLPQHQGRQAARAGHHQRQALAAAARRADDGRARRQGRRRSIRGRPSPRPRACRPTSRPSCTRPSSPALNDPAVKPKLLDLGFEIVGNTPEQFTAFQAAEFARWKKVIETGKITAD